MCYCFFVVVVYVGINSSDSPNKSSDTHERNFKLTDFYYNSSFLVDRVTEYLRYPKEQFYGVTVSTHRFHGYSE